MTVTIVAQIRKRLNDVAYLPLLLPDLLRRYRKFAFGALTVCALVAFGTFWQFTRPPAGLAFRLAAAEPNLTRVHFTRNGKLLAAGAANGRVLLWDAQTRYPLPLGQQSSQQITCLDSTPDQFLIAGTLSQRLLVWNLKRKSFVEIPKQAAPISAVAVRPSQPELAIGLSDGTLQLLNTTKGTFTTIPSGHKGSIKCLAYAPDGRTLVTGGEDGQIILRDAGTRAVRKTLAAHQGDVSVLTYSPDGKLLLSGDWTGKIVIWTMPVGVQLKEMQQPEAVSGGAFVGERVVTGGWDGRLRFWSVAASRLDTEYDARQVIHDLAVTPDGHYVVTVSPTADIAYWTVPR